MSLDLDNSCSRFHVSGLTDSLNCSCRFHAFGSMYSLMSFCFPSIFSHYHLLLIFDLAASYFALRSAFSASDSVVSGVPSSLLKLKMSSLELSSSVSVVCGACDALGDR